MGRPSPLPIPKLFSIPHVNETTLISAPSHAYDIKHTTLEICS